MWQSGILPKGCTQAQEFVDRNKSWDGRGVVVGVLDTGVDPLAPGLNSRTSDGKQKVIHVVDCSGSGDVAMGPPQSPDELERTLTRSGHSLGRIRINPAWVNPTDKWRVGQKRLLDLYPRGLKDRMADQRKKQVAQTVNLLEAQIMENDSDSPEDAKLQLAQLRVLEKEIGSGPGPMLECITWHDGERHQAAIHDGTDLSTIDPITDFSHGYQARTFDHFNVLLTYAVNIYDSGSTLSIVVDAGSHGTHVAGIVSAFHQPGDDINNGVAPGAQIVSLKIGDTRLGSMETGVGLYRALLEARRCGCDIVNMSYGEGTAFPDR